MENLKALTEKLNIQNNVEFKPNLPFPELQEYQKTAKIGMHAMINEHFGIVVVEFQANGVIPVAHNSAGPKEDIIAGTYGYLADDKNSFTESLLNISKLTNDELIEMRKKNFKHSQTFSHGSFIDKFGKSMQKVMD